MSGKTRPDDPRTLRDHGADPVDRAAALSRLVADGRREHEGEIAALLTHTHPLLRGGSILALAGCWRMDGYLADAYRLLDADPDWVVRGQAARALSMYAQDAPGNAEPILRALARVVRRDVDPGVQQAAYEGVLAILGRPAAEYFHETRFFDARRDADWALLSPYLAPLDRDA